MILLNYFHCTTYRVEHWALSHPIICYVLWKGLPWFASLIKLCLPSTPRFVVVFTKDHLLFSWIDCMQKHIISYLIYSWLRVYSQHFWTTQLIESIIVDEWQYKDVETLLYHIRTPQSTIWEVSQILIDVLKVVGEYSEF